MTRWQGTSTATVLAAMAVPTARAALGAPQRRANSEYDSTCAGSVRMRASHTLSWKGDPRRSSWARG